VADLGEFDIDTPWSQLRVKDRKMILFGTGTKEVALRYRNRFGRTRNYESAFEGVVSWLQRRHGEADSDWTREQIEGYMREVACASCHGARLKPEILAITIGDLSIAQLCDLSIGDVVDFFGTVEFTDREHMIADRVTKEILERLRFLLDVGLDYLSLGRASATLSGGEAQRIRLASQIGSGLVGVLYVLDEPSIGLHQRDNQRLIQTLIRLRDLGNTVIVVEHDEDTIRTADYIVDIGPGAGEHGGEVMHAGAVLGKKGLISSKASLTGLYLSGKRSIAVPEHRRKGSGKNLEIIGANEHNLKDVQVKIPLGKMVAVTGVSGSGKSTLVNEILLKSLLHQIHRSQSYHLHRLHHNLRQNLP
jgi:excinuclease ABC subunit A